MQELPPIPDDQDVWISTERDPKPGTVVSAADTPRSYIVDTPPGEIQRNRSQLRVVPDIPTEREPVTAEIRETQPRRVTTRSQSGVELKPPDRLA